MNLRKLLDWKSLFIYVHRWTGLAFGLLFVVWFISGVVMMYVRMPVLSVAERLGHVGPIDLSTATLTPAEALQANGLKSTGLRLEMAYDGRPLYRFDGNQKVYADTGERVSGADSEEALALIRRWVPGEFADTVRYDGYLLDSDLWTLYSAQRSAMPMHRISVGDPAGTVYYVSEKTGEVNHKTDRRGRFWGFLSGVLHYIYIPAFRRQTTLWQQVVGWGAVAGAVMALLGLVVGIFRLRVFGQYRLRSGPSHSPYVTWLRWHHWGGLIFGVLTITWAFSGAMSLNRPLSLRNEPPTAAQRTAVPGTPLEMETLTLPRLRAAVAAFATAFRPKAVDVHQFRGEPYLIADRPPAPWSYAAEIGSHEEQYTPLDHRIVSVLVPERGLFTRFEDERMWDIAKAAMPHVPIRDAVWLQDYDAYYYDKNRQRPLPVLRVRYADPAATWLYLDPGRGTMTRQDSNGRWNRWLYHGLHSLDFPFLRFRRPLWDIVVIVLSIGGLVVSATTLVPSWRRLKRHARHWASAVRDYRKQRAPFVPAGSSRPQTTE